MGNRFLALAAGAPGASTDCTALGAGRTVVVGGALTGPVVLEASQDNTNWVPLHTFGAAGSVEFEVAAAFMRINGGGGGVNADVAGEDSLTTTVTALNVTAGNGSGTGSDVSLLGDVKTIVVTGAFTGAVIIEQSLDAGVTWDPVTTFSGPGQWTSGFSAQLVRVTRNNAGGATPVVSIGGANIDAADRQEVINPPVTIATLARLDTTLQVNSTGGAVIVNLPVLLANMEGARIVIKETAAVPVGITVTPNAGAGDTINGAATFAMTGARNAIIIEANGLAGPGNWNVIAQFKP